MAVEPREIRVDAGPRPRPGVSFGEEPPLGELFRQLSDDASRLIRQEVALAKAEIRETATALVKDAVKIGIAVAFGLLGAIALTAFLIVGLGALMGNYWLAALIVTVVLLGVAAWLASSGMRDMRNRELKPTQTMETLRADADWARDEVDAMKQELRA